MSASFCFIIKAASGFHPMAKHGFSFQLKQLSKTYPPL